MTPAWCRVRCCSSRRTSAASPPTLLNAISGVGVFFLFGFLTLVALAYFWRRVPETKGRSLQEIEQELTGGKA